MASAEYMKSYRAKRRIKAINLLGGKCVECGSTEKLEFDHKDPETKEFTISGFHQPWNKILEELKKCQLLCLNCHANKTHGVPHGGGKSGKRNCKCDLCSAKKKEYKQMYKLYGRMDNWPKS